MPRHKGICLNSAMHGLFRDVIAVVPVSISPLMESFRQRSMESGSWRTTNGATTMELCSGYSYSRELVYSAGWRFGHRMD
jgi:hypothetical protein